MRHKKGSKMVPKWTPNRENWCQQIACVFHRVWRWVLRGAPESSRGLKPTKPVPKSGQLVPKPAQPVPKAAQLVPKAAQLVPKAAQLVAKSANLIGLRTVSRPKVGPIFKTPDQPPKRPGMLSLNAHFQAKFPKQGFRSMRTQWGSYGSESKGRRRRPDPGLAAGEQTCL